MEAEKFQIFKTFYVTIFVEINFVSITITFHVL